MWCTTALNQFTSVIQSSNNIFGKHRIYQYFIEILPGFKQLTQRKKTASDDESLKTISLKTLLKILISF